MSRTYDTDPDEAPCGRCGKPVALDHDPPCPHGWVACPECGHVAVCSVCSLAAEREMCASGVYDERADPLFDHTAADAPPPADLAAVLAEQEAHLARRRAASGYDPITNSHRPRGKA